MTAHDVAADRSWAVTDCPYSGSVLSRYAGSNEISCSLFAPKDEKWRASKVAPYCRATRRSRVALNFWRAVDPANEIDQSTLSEPRIVSAGVRIPDAGMNV